MLTTNWINLLFLQGSLKRIVPPSIGAAKKLGAAGMRQRPAFKACQQLSLGWGASLLWRVA